MLLIYPYTTFIITKVFIYYDIYIFASPYSFSWLIENTPNAKKSQKIKGNDFRAWDKYDAEEECKKVDDPDHVPTKKKVRQCHMFL